jgi:hypothetical protein
MTAQTAQQSPPAKHYTFGPREAGGLILGQSGGQLLLIAAILGMFLTILTPGLALAARVIVIAIMALLLAFGWMPVYLGLPPIHWTRLFVSARLQRWTGQITYRGGLFRMRNDEWEVPAARLPGLLGATRWLELATGPSSPPIGLWHDHREHTYTAVLILEGSSFHLLETEEQERRESAYGRMLAALCDSARHLKRLQILERTVPDTGDTLHRDYTSRASHLVRPDDAHPPQAAIDSYEAVIAAAGPVGQRHETYVAVCLDAKSAARDIARAGGGDRGAAAVVDREIRRLSADLVSAGVRVHGYAPPRQLAYILRTAFDPAVTPLVDQRGGAVSDVPGGSPGLASGVDPRQAGPAHAKSLWSAYRTDSGWHRGFWVAEWPRKAAPSAFLTPLLLFCRYRRAISITFEPRSVRLSARRLDKKADRNEGEEGLRRWLRLRRKKRSAMTKTHLDRREEALLNGEGMLSVRAFVVVTATDPDELDAAEHDVMSLAQQSQLELQPMYNAHDQAFAVAAVPMARSL